MKIDIETTFLESKIKGETYIELPSGVQEVQGHTQKMEKLNMALYGLPESSRCFYDKLKSFLVKTIGCKKDSKKSCNGKSTKCITHNFWDELDIHINSFFENKKLSDLLKNREARI